MSHIDPEVTGRRAYRVGDFCTAYGVSRDTVERLIKAGKLPDVKIGGRRVIPVDAAEALLNPQIAAA